MTDSVRFLRRRRNIAATLLVAVGASVGLATAASAGVTVTVGPTLNASPFDNNPAGAPGSGGVLCSSCTTNTNDGPITFTGYVAVGTDVNNNAEPLGDSSNYVYGSSGTSPVTVTFNNGPQYSMEILWGSIDGPPGGPLNNILTLTSGGVPIVGGVVTGGTLVSDIGALGVGSQASPLDNQWVQITSTTPFNGFTAASSGNAFEFDMGAAVPEPATWAFMLLGFAGLGFAGYSKSKRTRITVRG